LQAKGKREKGKAKMARTNPYNIRGMIPIDSDMFFGRERETRRIEDMLSSDTPQCVSVIGERRIGKSSLVLRVYHKMKALENTLAVYLDCDGLSERCKSKDDFFKLLNQLFLEALEEKPEIKKLVEKGFNTYSSFKAFIKNCVQKGIKTIIFIDEFEHLPAHKFADDTFFSNLRATANNPDNRLAFVTISKKELKELAHQSITTSNFWNIFRVEIIGLLEHKSIERLRRYGFEKTNIFLTEKEIEKIHYYAGDFPFFNQVACGFLWNSKAHDDPLDWDNLEVEAFPYYEKLWEDRTKEEQKLLKKIISAYYLDDFAVKEMRSRGILWEEKKLYFPFSDYFEELLKRRLKVKRKKITLKTIFHYIKEAMGIAKSGKEIVTGK
jgi:hypothetical protein